MVIPTYCPYSLITNFLFAAFTHTDPKSTERQSSHQYLFTLLGSLRVRVAHRTVMKLTPEESC